MKADLPEFYSNIKAAETSASGSSACRGSPGAGQCAGETKPVQQAEGKRYGPGGAGEQHWFRHATSETISGPKKQNTQRNCGVQRRSTGTSAVSKCRNRERDAVRHGECAVTSLQQHPAVFHDQQQAQNEEHMICTGIKMCLIPCTMLNMWPQLSRPGLGGCWLFLPRGCDGLCTWSSTFCRQATPRARANVGDGHLQTAELDALAPPGRFVQPQPSGVPQAQIR